MRHVSGCIIGCVKSFYPTATQVWRRSSSPLRLYGSLTEVTMQTEQPTKPQTRKEGCSTGTKVAAVVVFVIVVRAAACVSRRPLCRATHCPRPISDHGPPIFPQAAAIAVPLGIIYSKDAGSSVQVSFTANGDVSDYDAAEQAAILSTLSTSAGFASVPGDSTLTLTAGSVTFLATFPVDDETAAQTAKAALQLALPDHASIQTLLAAVVPDIIVETLPKIKAVEGTKPAMEPSAPFALLGHWLTDSGSALTFTDVEQITISGWAEHITPIIYYTDTYYITQKPAADEWNPKKFQKVNFHTTADGSIATCTSKMDADTEADAIAFDPVGVYSTDTDQCGQFTHSTMTPYTMPVAGTWAVGAGTLTVTDDQWQSVQSWGTTVKTIKTFVSRAPAEPTHPHAHSQQLHSHVVSLSAARQQLHSLAPYPSTPYVTPMNATL